jgi:hypothetical protein
MNVVRQYFAGLKADAIKECEQIDNLHRVWKQKRPIQVTHLDEDLAAESESYKPAVPRELLKLMKPLRQTI